MHLPFSALLSCRPFRGFEIFVDLDVSEPAFLTQIEGQELSLDITQEITSFVFEDNEEQWTRPDEYIRLFLPPAQLGPVFRRYPLKTIPEDKTWAERASLITRAFRLTGVEKTREDGIKRNGRRVALRTPEEQLDWLRRKGAVGGFDLIEGSSIPDVRMQTEQDVVARRATDPEKPLEPCLARE